MNRCSYARPPCISKFAMLLTAFVYASMAAGADRPNIVIILAGDHAPETQGFDVSVGGTRWGAPQTFFWPYRGSGRFGQDFRYVPGLPLGKPGDYLTDKLTDAAIAFIDSAAQRPFFLLMAHHA